MSIKLWNYKTHITWGTTKANPTNVLRRDLFFILPLYGSGSCAFSEGKIRSLEKTEISFVRVAPKYRMVDNKTM